ncbi:MAG: hypothetical protein ACXW3O_01515 [Brevundimonas sp.]
MGDDAGYHWNIEAQAAEWVWTIRKRDDGRPLLTGTAASRPHAAACVVRALILGVTAAHQAEALAA